MGRQLRLVGLAALAAMVVGCGSDDDPNAHLNAPLSKKVGNTDAMKERGVSPEETARMAESRGGPRKR